MAPWLVVILVVAIVSTVALMAILIALARHGLVVGRAAKQASEELGPVGREISRDAERIAVKVAALQPPRARSQRSGRR